MAEFLEAYELTKVYEGGYSNRASDLGGETYKGIARKRHPTWEGWGIIDSLKGNIGFPSTAYSNRELDSMVIDFYRRNFWSVNKLSEFPSQLIANELFDTGVNLGTGKAALFLQRALNALNKEGTIYSDISEDGVIGPNTIKALTSCLKYKGEEFLYKLLNLQQGNHYFDLAREKKSQEANIYGWLTRVDFIKK